MKLRLLCLDTEPVKETFKKLVANIDFKRSNEGDIYLDFKQPQYDKIRVREIAIYDITLELVEISKEENHLNVEENFYYDTFDELLSVNPDNFTHLLTYNGNYDLFQMSAHFHRTRSKEDNEKLAKICELPNLDLQRVSSTINFGGRFLKLKEFYEALYGYKCQENKLHEAKFDIHITLECLYNLFETERECLIEIIKFKTCSEL